MNHCLHDLFNTSEKRERFAKGLPDAFNMVGNRLPSNPAVGLHYVWDWFSLNQSPHKQYLAAVRVTLPAGIRIRSKVFLEGALHEAIKGAYFYSYPVNTGWRR